MDTYTIVNPKEGDSYAGSLEQIREQLIMEAFKYNRPLGKFEDQVEAVSPADPSELDEEEDRLVPRELTRELVAKMAASIWDVPIKYIKLFEGKVEKGLTAGELGAVLYALNLTQFQFSQLIGEYPWVIGAWLRGKGLIPVTVTRKIERLAEVYAKTKEQLRNDLQRGVIVKWVESDKYENDQDFWNDYPSLEPCPVALVRRAIAELALENIVNKEEFEIV